MWLCHYTTAQLHTNFFRPNFPENLGNASEKKLEIDKTRRLKVVLVFANSMPPICQAVDMLARVVSLDAMLGLEQTRQEKERQCD